MKTLTASDKESLIKLASSLPQGDVTRKAILAGLKNAYISLDKTPATATPADLAKMKAAAVQVTGKADVPDGYRAMKAQVQRFAYFEADSTRPNAGSYFFFALVNDPHSYAKPDLSGPSGFRTEYVYACAVYGKIGGSMKAVLLTKDSVEREVAYKTIRSRARKIDREGFRYLIVPGTSSLDYIPSVIIS